MDKNISDSDGKKTINMIQIDGTQKLSRLRKEETRRRD